MADISGIEDKYFLPFKAVHIQCLDKDKNKIKNANATGFIISENEAYFLYTCWHVVTGYDKNNVEVGFNLPNRKFLEINLQNFENGTAISIMGGNQNITIKLYDENDKPAWIQDEDEIPHYSLNCIGLKVPYYHDMIKILIDEKINISEVQQIENSIIFTSIPIVCEDVFIVGFPYGYSTGGLEQPTPIVLKRNIAAISLNDRFRDLLIDGIGAPGMSGSPVFIKKENAFLFLGIYTGVIYPDYATKSNEKTTALGVVNVISWWFMLNEPWRKLHYK